MAGGEELADLGARSGLVASSAPRAPAETPYPREAGTQPESTIGARGTRRAGRGAVGAESGAPGPLLSMAGISFRTVSAIGPDSDWANGGDSHGCRRIDPRRPLFLLCHSAVHAVHGDRTPPELCLRVLAVDPPQTVSRLRAPGAARGSYGPRFTSATRRPLRLALGRRGRRRGDSLVLLAGRRALVAVCRMFRESSLRRSRPGC